jgi:predicted alpha/beta-hydrolase family hydrolase
VDGPHVDVPGLAYLPATTDVPLPLVLIQHPATSSKDDYFVADVARQWVRRGWIVGGIDAPLHGEREDYDPMAIFRDRERFPEIRAVAANLAPYRRADRGGPWTRATGYVGY